MQDEALAMSFENENWKSQIASLKSHSTIRHETISISTMTDPIIVPVEKKVTFTVIPDEKDKNKTMTKSTLQKIRNLLLKNRRRIKKIRSSGSKQRKAPSSSIKHNPTDVNTSKKVKKKIWTT